MRRLMPGGDYGCFVGHLEVETIGAVGEVDAHEPRLPEARPRPRTTVYGPVRPEPCIL